MKKRKIKIIIPIIIIIFIVGVFASYFYLLTGSQTNEVVIFNVNAGTNKKDIAKNLKIAELVKSKNATLAYLFFNKEINLQAGKYELNRNMSVKEIVKHLSSGKVKKESISITFVEGKNMKDFIDLVSTKFGFSKEEVKAKLQDTNYIKELVKKYDFLTNDVLNDNIYYALEGYLFPDTYEFLETVSLEEIISTMLNNTKNKLESLNIKEEIHEILTKASIAELEAVASDDRKSVIQVINKRLEMGKGLGMDVTTYYAMQKPLGEELTMDDLRNPSLYNTSELNLVTTGRLPVGPICNPSLDAIKAVLNPSDTDYLYFYANIRTHEVFFANTYEEFLEIQRKVG